MEPQRPTWPGHGPPSGSSEDARTRAGPSPGAPVSRSSEDARTRAGASQTGAPGAARGRSSGPRAWVPGERVGPFVVKSLLGQGGMGAVYIVTHQTTGADYALKVLLAVDDAMGRARFEREGQAQASLPPHPNVVRVFGAGELEGVPYLLTELAPGGDLRGRLRQGPLEPVEACRLFVGLARALEHLHAHGVLHRDLKPHNIVFGADGAPKLMDFGLATLKGAEKLTVTGSFMGTPNYMAPEQVDGQKVDARADVYGLGATLYQTLCGRPPFDGEQGVNMITKILTQPPRALRSMQPGLPADVVRVVERAMARDLEARYPSAEAFALDLEKVAAGQPLDPPPPRPGGGLRRVYVAGGAALLCAALVAVGVSGRPRQPPVPLGPQTTSVAAPATSVPAEVQPPRPTGSRSTAFVPAGSTTMPRPAWLRPRESIRKGESATGPILRGDLPITRSVETYQVTDAGRFVLFLDVVRLPPGVVPLEDGACLNEADGSRLVFVPGRGDVAPFLLGEREATWGQYLRFARETKRSLDLVGLVRLDSEEVAPIMSGSEVVQITVAQRGPDYPVANVTAADARAYCARVGLRLPTPAEWYHAYEGAEAGSYPRGEGRPMPPSGNICPPNVTSNGPHPVGARRDDMTWCGALDMYGNVAEWCQQIGGIGHTCGGSFDEQAFKANTRDRQAQESRPQDYRGFRAACDLDRAAAPPPLPR